MSVNEIKEVLSDKHGKEIPDVNCDYSLKDGIRRKGGLQMEKIYLPCVRNLSQEVKYFCGVMVEMRMHRQQ